MIVNIAATFQLGRLVMTRGVNDKVAENEATRFRRLGEYVSRG